MKYIIYILILLFGSVSLADSHCSNQRGFKSIDFKNEFGPIREQSGVSWCYAYAAADLLTHYLYSQNEISGFSDKEIVSASAVALLNIQQDDIETVKGVLFAEGFGNELKLKNMKLTNEYKKIKRYISELNKIRQQAWGEKLDRINNEIRLHNKVASDIFQKIEQNKSQIERLEIQVPEEYRNSLQTGGNAGLAAIAMAKNGICTESKIRSSNLDTWNLLSHGLVDYQGRGDKIGILTSMVLDRKQIDPKAVNAMFPALSESEILEAKKNSSNVDLPFVLMKKTCEAKPVKVLPKSKSYYVDDPLKPRATEISEMFELIDHQIDNRNTIVFSTDGDLFDNIGASKQPYTFETGHAVLIVGKRFNCEYNEPEYIIRNSWGYSACEKYRADFRIKVPFAMKASEKIEDRMFKCKSSCSDSEGDEMENIRRCKENCQRIANEKLIALNRPPYYCEDGHYIVRKSHLIKAPKAIRYLVPDNVSK